MSKHQIQLDEERLARLLRAIAYAWRNGLFGLKGKKPPEERFLPDRCEIGTRDHAVYLFAAAAASRSGKSADQVIGETKQLWLRNRWILDPATDPGRWQSLEFRSEVAKWLPMGEQDNGRIKGWLQNLHYVRDHLGSDPRGFMLQHVPRDDSHEAILEARTEIIDHLRQLYNWEHKLAQLFGLWLQSVDWPEHKDEWGLLRKVPLIAVDIWFMRWVMKVGAVREWTSDDRNVIARPISDVLCRICLTEDISWVDAAQGIWHTMAEIHGRQPKTDLGRETLYCMQECPLHHACVNKVPNPIKKERDNGSLDRESTHRGRMQYHRAEPRLIDPRVLFGHQLDLHHGPEYEEFFRLLGELSELPVAPYVGPHRTNGKSDAPPRRKSSFVHHGAVHSLFVNGRN